MIKVKEKEKEQPIYKFSLPPSSILIDKNNFDSTVVLLNYTEYFPIFNLELQRVPIDESETSLCNFYAEKLKLEEVKRSPISNHSESSQTRECWSENIQKWRNKNNIYFYFKQSQVFRHYQFNEKDQTLDLKLRLDLKLIFSDSEVTSFDIIMKQVDNDPDILILLTNEKIIKIQNPKINKAISNLNYTQDTSILQKVGDSLKNCKSLITINIKSQIAYLVLDSNDSPHLLITEAVAHKLIVTETKVLDIKFKGRVLSHCIWLGGFGKFLCIDPETGLVELYYNEKLGSLFIGQVIVNKRKGGELFISKMGQDRIIFAGEENSTHNYVFYLTAQGKFEIKEKFSVLGKISAVEFSQSNYFIFTSDKLYSNYIKEFPIMSYYQLNLSAPNFIQPWEIVFLQESSLRGSTPVLFKADIETNEFFQYVIKGLATVELECGMNPGDLLNWKNQLYEISFFSINCPKPSNQNVKNFTTCFIHQQIETTIGEVSTTQERPKPNNTLMEKLSFEGEYKKEINSVFWKVFKVLILVGGGFLCVGFILYYICKEFKKKQLQKLKKESANKNKQKIEAKKLSHYDDIEEDGDEIEMNSSSFDYR